MVQSNVKATQINGKAIGILTEHNLEIRPYKRKVDGVEEMQNAITGMLTVESNGNAHTYRVFTYEKNSKGEDSKVYKGWQTFINEYKTKKEFGADADTVQIRYGIGINDYVNKQGQLVTGVLQLQANNITRVGADTEHMNDIELQNPVIASMKSEVKDGKETGRGVINLFCVGHDGKAIPLTAYANEEDFEGMTDTYSQWDNAEISLSLTRAKNVVESNNKVAFGRKAKVTSGFAPEELIVIGGGYPIEEMEDEDGNLNIITKETVQAMLNERKAHLAEIETKGYQGGKSKPEPKKTAPTQSKKRMPVAVDEPTIDDLFG